MGKTSYVKASNLSEAVSYLKHYGSNAILLAGGTDLMVQANQYLLPEETVFISIESIKKLKEIYEDAEGIHIGSMVTDSDLLESELIRTRLHALYMAAKESASPQVRNRATIGGNVATASPSGDLLTALIALNAQAMIMNTETCYLKNVREIPISVKKNCLKEDELISEFIIRPDGKNEGSYFLKIGKRKAMSISIVSIAARISLSAQNDILDISIAAGAVAPTVVRMKNLEKKLLGQKAEESVFDAAKETALSDVSPITDIRATAWYRQELVKVFSKRTLTGAVQNAKELS
jgi:xanthine dehydrogenase FAD-binding subunit